MPPFVPSYSAYFDAMNKLALEAEALDKAKAAAALEDAGQGDAAGDDVDAAGGDDDR